MAASPSLPAPYHGTHLAAAQANCEPVDWQRPIPRADRIRVREHTCECRTVIYELCATSGLVFVRKHYRKNGTTTVWESPWRRAAEGLSLWDSILRGFAR
ncbi:MULTISPECIES: hypothetical protein [Streptosporangium]|uniref:Uncharacterized protein n=1 Tax=Streptosporangium album TaxID=47479 RepID=A0A7W7RWC7_9ACTN|nr:MULTISPECIES: hypothetical protein [Streptosporangium]MBB4939385.1 hypothetical protein [Streptosporangium album]WSC89450.1 hypothetical protein OIE48_15080 [Streptosporangium sp. NBC_01756]